MGAAQIMGGQDPSVFPYNRHCRGPQFGICGFARVAEKIFRKEASQRGQWMVALRVLAAVTANANQLALSTLQVKSQSRFVYK